MNTTETAVIAHLTEDKRMHLIKKHKNIRPWSVPNYGLSTEFFEALYPRSKNRMYWLLANLRADGHILYAHDGGRYTV